MGEFGMPHIPFTAAVATYWSYALLTGVGHIRDFFASLFIFLGIMKKSNDVPKGYAPIVNDYQDFYTRRLYHRISDCWNRPVTGCPGAEITVLERKSLGYLQPYVMTGESKKCINLGSYNYLGFGDPDSPTKPDVFRALDQFSVTTSSSRAALGTTTLHAELEALVAEFVGKESAIVFGMGYGTNSTGIPALVGKGSLIISDSNNHASIAVGCRSSGATIKIFNHNQPHHLESVIRRAIVEGQPRTHRPWKKIIIMVEGIYSMEGEMCVLQQIVEIKKKYKCYLYVDEAHSIGAIGHTGRGICDQTNVNPKDVDILMGTFTKSFGAVGGYICGSKQLIDFIKASSAGYCYSSSISPPAAQQCISAIKIMMGLDGTDLGQRKIRTLKDNANWFRDELKARHLHVLGETDSPVVPLLLYHPAKIVNFSRECFKRGLAVVVVGFPATPLLLARARICISAAHTKEQLQKALDIMDEVIDKLNMKYNKWLF